MSPAATASRDVASLVTADRVHRAVYVDPDGNRRVEDTSAANEGSAVAPGAARP